MPIRLLEDVSIRNKVILLVMGISLSALGLTFAIFTFMGVKEEQRRAVGELAGLGDFIGVNIRASLMFDDPEFANESLQALHTRGDISAAYILDREQGLFAWYFPGQGEAPKNRSALESDLGDRLARHGETLGRKGLLHSENAIHMLRPVSMDRELLGFVYLQSDLAPMKRAIARRSIAALWALALSLLLAYLLSCRLHRFISKPIDEMTAAMETISGGEDYSLRIRTNRRDEFGRLMAGFNHMLGQIESRDHKLEEANRILEERVESRTRELYGANVELRREVEYRRLAEEIARKNATKFRQMFEKSPISLWEEDCSELLEHLKKLRQEGIEDFRAYFSRHPREVRSCTDMVRILDVNQRALEKFGAREKSQLLAGLEQVFCEKTYPAFMEMLIAMAEGRNHFEVEGVCRTLEGEERIFNILFSMFPEADYGKLVVSLIDVTESRKSEAALKQSEERFRILLEQAADGVVVNDLQGRIVEVNQRACEIMGYSREELLSMRVRELATIVDSEILEESWTEIAPGSSVTRERRALRKDGTVLDVEAHVGVIQFPDHRKILALIRDVTRRKEMERELESTKARLEHLLNSSPAVIYTTKTSGKGITSVSPNVTWMLGYEPAQVVDHPDFWNDRLHPDDSERILANIPAGIGRGVHLHEYRFRHRDGSYRWLLDEFRLVENPEGEPLEVVGYWIDISQRKEAVEKLKASLAEKEVLLQEVHHRVKNNLQIITSLLNLQCKQSQQQQTRDELLVARNRIRSMAHIHESLYGSKDLSRIDFPGHVKAFAERLLNLYDAVHVSLVFDLDQVRLDVAAAIPCSLIINELMTNALKYAFPDGRHGTIIVGLKAGEGSCTLFVEDDGVGIPEIPEKQSRTALGLFLVDSLAGQVGGRMIVERRNGTRVAVEFPV